MTLALWIFALMLHMQPADKTPQFPGHTETAEQARARYAELADAIAGAAIEDEDVSDGLSDRDEAALLVAVSFGESRWSKDTDEGPCFRGKLKTPSGIIDLRERCDFGKASSVWQLHAWNFEGRKRTSAEVFGDRRLAARMALTAVRWSRSRCRKLPARDRLSALGGRCVEGLKSAQDHYDRWRRIRRWEPPTSSRSGS